MRISSIPQIYRHVGRWTEILSVLSKYGLANWIGRLGPDFAKDFLKGRGGSAIARQPWQARIRMAMNELGPTFIKLGQVLSTRPDLIGIDLADELRKLQTEVPADPPATVTRLIEQELGHPVDVLFAEFDPVPLASASIGQVHKARLTTGQWVAVKVQHAEIERRVNVDSDILSGVAVLAERIPEFANYRPRAIASEFQRTIRRELDFRRELRNMETFASNFVGDPNVHIPRTYPQLSTRRVLTMEWIDGIKLTHADELCQADCDMDALARRGARIYLDMIFSHGFYHADPHPGNVLVLAESVFGLLDFGMVGRLDERTHESITEMLMAMVENDGERLAAAVCRVGAVPAEMDRSALSVDVTDFVCHFGSQSVEEIDLSGALTEMLQIVRRYQIMLPARVGMLIKVLITLEGTSRLISPQFSLIEVMRPYRRKLLMQRLSPGRRIRKLRRLMTEMEHVAEVLPQGLIDILSQMQSGKFDVHLDHRGLEPSVNRLVTGMLASALFLGSAVMLAEPVPPTIRGYSLLGLLGGAMSVALGLRLWRAISKSGHLDRH